MREQQDLGKGPSLRRWSGYFCIALGLVLILSSFNTGWGTAYGQTVVTPTPSLVIGDPYLIKTVEPGCGEPGDEVIYTIVATNIGGANVTNVVISDTIPPQLALQEVTTTKGTLTVSGNSFQVVIDVIAPGEIVTIVVKAIVLEGAEDDTIVINTAYMSSDQGDRESSAEIVLRDPGGCAEPPILPPTGGPALQPTDSTSPALLLAGIVLVLLGIVLVLGMRRRAPADSA